MKKNKSSATHFRLPPTEEAKGHGHISSMKFAPSFLRKLGLIVAIVGILCYTNTLSFHFALDDTSIITQNTITKMGVAAIGKIFTSPYREGYTTQGDQLYRPIPKSIFAILWSLSPGNPFPGHLINVLLFGLTGFLLFITLTKYLGSQIYISFITSLLFMAHPIHTEVVANIKSLDEILSFLFFVMSLYWLHRFLFTQKLKWILLAAASYMFSLLSKESSITFVALFPLIIYFFSSPKRSLLLKVTFVMMVPAIIFLLIRAIIFKGIVAALPPVADNMLMLAANDFVTQKATAIYLLGYYVKLLILPHPLVFDYSLYQFNLVHASDWRFLLSLIFFIGLGIFIILNFKKKSLLAFGILFFFITISISSNLFKVIGTHFAERLMYTPSFGFCLVLACLLSYFIDRKEEVKQKFSTVPRFMSSRPVLLSIIALLTITYGIITFTQSRAWHDNLSLFEHGVKSAPKSMRTHYYLGNYLIEGEYYNSLPAAKQVEERKLGMMELKKSIAIYPYSESYFSLGIAHYLMHEYDSSLYYYKEAIRLAPHIATYHNNIATVYFETKEMDKALAECQQAVQLDPNYAEAYCNLGSVYGSMNQMDDALLYFEKAIAIDPNHARANYYMGKILQNSTKPEDQSRARIYLDKARALDPKYNN